MKNTNKIKGAEVIGVKIKVSKSLDKYSDVVLFPKKLAKANRLLKGIKLPDNI